MVFTVENKLRISPKLFKAAVFCEARSYIIRHQLKTTEKILDKYLQENYKVSLKALCIYLLRRATYTEGANNTILVRFKDLKDDQLATLVTYGNGRISGSKILRRALS